jgi:hypothetical protein
VPELGTPTGACSLGRRGDKLAGARRGLRPREAVEGPVAALWAIIPNPRMKGK